jgi:hypothetical protein
VTAAGEGLLVTADQQALRVATAPPGTAFGAPRRFTDGGLIGSGLALADPHR